jgi:hypothetical protein
MDMLHIRMLTGHFIVCLHAFNLLCEAIFVPPYLREREMSSETMITSPYLALRNTIYFILNAFLFSFIINSEYIHTLLLVIYFLLQALYWLLSVCV